MINKILTLTIKSIASTGKGVALLDVDGFKRPVFVPRTVPGDVISARITKQHKKYYEAELISIQTPSLHRIQPPCKHFGVCGACDWLHIDYAYQLVEKEKILKFLFSRKNISYPKITVISAQEPLHYRKKIRTVVANKAFSFYQAQSKIPVPISECAVVDEQFNKKVFSQPASKNRPDGEYVFVIDEKTGNVLTAESSKIPSYFVTDNISLDFSPLSFVQSNFSQNRKLVQTVLSYIPENEVVLDLYAGIGNFTIPIAKKSRQVLAVEGNPVALSVLESNLKKHKLNSVLIFPEDVHSVLLSETMKAKVVVLDPPRDGVGDSISHLSLLTNTIVYVSCNPVSLVADLTVLLKNDFKIKDVVLVDLFPQTHHFETVVFLSR